MPMVVYSLIVTTSFLFHLRNAIGRKTQPYRNMPGQYISMRLNKFYPCLLVAMDECDQWPAGAIYPMHWLSIVSAYPQPGLSDFIVNACA